MINNTEYAPMLSVDRELLLESQYEGMTQEQAQAVSDGIDEILHGEPVVMMPEFLDMPPFSTIDRGSKNYKAGYNAALRKVSEMNGLSHDQT